jgi:hypothetical protein
MALAPIKPLDADDRAELLDIVEALGDVRIRLHGIVNNLKGDNDNRRALRLIGIKRGVIDTVNALTTFVDKGV